MHWFCPNCEILGKAIKDNRLYYFNCAECMLAMDIEITVLPRKSWDDVNEIFQKTDLTHSQHYGTSDPKNKRTRIKK